MNGNIENRCSCGLDLLRMIRIVVLWGILIVPRIVHGDEHNDELFERFVRPLLIEHCQQCHDEKKQESGLRLDSRQAMVMGGDRGPAIIPGQANGSLLIKAIRYHDDLQMPPNGRLTDAQIDAVVEWIELGAPWPGEIDGAQAPKELDYRQHWAFLPITKPAPPTVVDHNDWARNEIDQFVLAKLQANGLTPQTDANRRDLLRRVFFDLTGLPPTIEEVEQFELDRRPEAYEQVVDRLLVSRQYAEHWARKWLDVARYSDTKGYVYAREERFWIHAAAYREWVIDAFEQDMPYDRFVMLQIAADQVAPEDSRAQAAMGYLTLGRRFLGVTHDIIDDRIDVVSRGLMGLTASCARCHNHKFDPIPTADYYSLYGVFLNSREQIVPIADTLAAVADDDAYRAELTKRQTNLQNAFAKHREEASARVRQRVGDYLIAQTEIAKYPQEGFDTILAPTDLVPTFVRRWEAYLQERSDTPDRVFNLWKQLCNIDPSQFAELAKPVLDRFRLHPDSINQRLWVAIESQPRASIADVAQCYGKLFQEIDTQWKTACDDATDKGLEPPKSLPDPADEELRQILYAADSPCLVPDESIVSTETFFNSDVCTELWKLQGEVERWLIQSPKADLYTIRLIDRQKDYPAYVFRRGNPANRSESVKRHFFAFLSEDQPVSFTRGSGRLELAQAIAAPDNPLTARVWVNRIWQSHFGVGLVKSASDFGMRADPPSHPELLDWLAQQLIAEGWSTKKLHRRIVLSSTYRQSSQQAKPGNERSGEPARADQIDPENRLLHRMNRKRLSFEQYRDSLLQFAARLEPSDHSRSTDLFANAGADHRRRTLYGLVDRQFLSTVLRTFDFANPDLHIAQRSETTVPQQALFSMNHPFLAQQARAVAARATANVSTDDSTSIAELYRLVLQRNPSVEEQNLAIKFLQASVPQSTPKPPESAKAWQYGFASYEPVAGSVQAFKPLPYFSNRAWSGGANWPDPNLGWVQLTARGGHPGNDLQHAAVRRWVAPQDGTYGVLSEAVHKEMPGDGVRFSIILNGSKMLLSSVVHNRKQALNVEALTLKQGETIDFVADINSVLNSDQHEWIAEISGSGTDVWNSERDFWGPIIEPLTPFEQLAQVLLMSNELMFLD
jgi:Protein of unknown function (DUF1553)/Protein of unknown function (DUF1549)/Planctomycete cytochrome C